VRHHARRLWWFEAGARAGEVEAVHQMRVQTRRLRAILRLFAPKLEDAALVRSLRDRLRTLAGALGAVRDLDVRMAFDRTYAELAKDAAVHAAIIALKRRAARDRPAALAALLAHLGSPSVSWLRATLEVFSHAPLPSAGAPSAARRFAHRALDRELRRVRRRFRQARDQSPEPMHALRRALKAFRYGAEALSPLLSGRGRAVARRAAGLQDVLGVIHDLDVAASLFEHERRVRERIAVARHDRLRGFRRKMKALWKGRRG
jgi:CHAD domain-containing protein